MNKMHSDTYFRYQLMDDVGNKSAVYSLGPVTFDNEAPIVDA
jgi:hypothetical protein